MEAATENTMTVETLHDKFVYHLQMMYYVENKLLDVLDTIASDVTNEDLQRGLEEHRKQTETYVALLEERQQFFEQAAGDEDMRDLHDLGAAAKNEHLEIASYENLIMLARKLDLPMGVRQNLDDNLEEEQQTKKQLKAMADDSAVRKIFARFAG